MQRSSVVFLGAVVLLLTGFLAVDWKAGHGQRPSIRGTRGQLGTRITGERTNRQTEVDRLQRQIDQLDARIQLLERQAVVAGRLPPLTREESQAALELAEAQLAANQEDQAAGQASELDLARDRLQLARARAQIKIADASRTERRIAIESEIAYAQKRLQLAKSEQDRLERLVAQGFAPTDSLEIKRINVQIAQTAFDRLQARLKQLEPTEPESPAGE